MRRVEAIGRIRTLRHIRTLRSVVGCTGPGRLQTWSRVRDLEAIQMEKAKQLKMHRRSQRHGPAPQLSESAPVDESSAT
jgi:hypothetical protein